MTPCLKIKEEMNEIRKNVKVRTLFIDIGIYVLVSYLPSCSKHCCSSSCVSAHSCGTLNHNTFLLANSFLILLRKTIYKFNKRK